MRVLVAMSGGVDSSVAAALLAEEGHDVVGCTLQLWGGPSDSGCCSAADVDDARRVAQVVGIDHHVFNLSERFEDRVVAPYVAAHQRGETPNPCVACNREIKFDALLSRARRLGFDALATGHHARVVDGADGRELRRGADSRKDQSYVLGFLDAAALSRVELPVGDLTKSEVRSRASELGLRTAGKPDSQEVCFIPRGHRGAFLAERADLTPATVRDADTGAALGTVPAAQLVTVGQRRGLGVGSDGLPRFAVDVDVAGAVVTVATREASAMTWLGLDASTLRWARAPRTRGEGLLVQTSAHGEAVPATLESRDGLALGLVRPVRPVAAGQLAVFYDTSDPDLVIGSATVERRARPRT